MAYILFLNPAILGFQGIPDLQPLGLPFPAVLTATALVAGVATIAMGLWANYPFAIASGLGLNAFVAFTLVAEQGLTYPEAMGVIVAEGLVITLLVLTRFRQAVMNAVPIDMKRAIAIGIGLFLTIIGLVNAGVVVRGEGTILALTDNFTSLRMLTFAIGLALASIFVVRRMRGGLLLAILVTTAVGAIINGLWGDNRIWEAVGPGIAQIPDDVIGSPDFSIIGDVSFGFFGTLGVVAALLAVFTVMLSDFFDTMGTAVALGDEAGLLDRDGKLPNVDRVLLVDSLAAAAGGAASASSRRPMTFATSCCASWRSRAASSSKTSVAMNVLGSFMSRPMSNARTPSISRLGPGTAAIAAAISSALSGLQVILKRRTIIARAYPARARARLSKQLCQPLSWSRTASSSHRSLWVKWTVVMPSASSKSIWISVRVGLWSQIQVKASRLGGSISV
jgi:AGZA family xanthine/uracil permease-like MFS transporter